MPNPSVLERQLIHMDLKKGMNELVRAECGDPTSHLTLVQNLQQEQNCSWTKRPGLTALGGGLSGVKRLAKLRGTGVGAIHENGSLSIYSENKATWKTTMTMPSDLGQMPHFTASSDQVASSDDKSVGNIGGHASTSKYHYISYAAGNSQFHVAVYDRETGCQIHRYTGMSTVETCPKMTVVANRYVVLFWGYFDGGGNQVYCTAVDTNSTWEINFGVAAIATPASGNVTPGDVAASATNAFVVTQDAVYRVSTAGALVDSVAAAALSSIAASPTMLWVSDAANMIAYSVTDLTTILVASAAHGGVAGSITVDDNNRVYHTSSTGVRTTTADGGTTFGTVQSIVGWNLSYPFYMSGSTSVYCEAVRLEGGVVLPGAMRVVLNITRGGAIQDIWGLSGSGIATWLARCEAILEPFNSADPGPVNRPEPYSSSAVGIPVAVRTVARGYSYTMVNLELFKYQRCGQARFGEQAYITGGTPCAIGSYPREIGFVDRPEVTAADSGNAGNPDGSYKYVAVHRYVDETGAVAWSRVSPIASVTVATNTVNITVTPVTVSLRTHIAANAVSGLYSVVTELYRTKSGGTQYYLCASSSTSAASQDLAVNANGYWAVEDNLSDATLAAQAILFRQPGTPNSPADRYPAPPSTVLTAHKDRLYTTSANHESVYYSSFFVDGETPWFNPSFGFFVHGGTGPITGMASLDGRLVVFKHDAIFVIDGDGPGEAGPAGNEFGTPNQIATEYGCVDHRSIQVFAGGILYRSVRGVELLTRGFELRFVGDRVQTTVAANPYVVGSVMDHDSRYRLLIAESAPTDSFSGINGCEVVYDTQSDCWSKNVYLSGQVPQDVVSVKLNGTETTVYARPTVGVYKADLTSGLDAGTYVSWRITSGWIRTGQQARQFIDQIQVLAKKLTNHKATISVAYNYVDNYGTDTKSFEPDVINAAEIEQLQKNTARNQVLAASFNVQDAAPTDTVTYPITTGRACDILGLTVQVAVKSGASQLDPDQKG